MKSGFSKHSDSKFQRVMFGSFSTVCWKLKKKGLLSSLGKFFLFGVGIFSESVTVWRTDRPLETIFVHSLTMQIGRDENLIWNRKVRKSWRLFRYQHAIPGFDPVWRQVVNDLFIRHLLFFELTKKWRVKNASTNKFPVKIENKYEMLCPSCSQTHIVKII